MQRLRFFLTRPKNFITKLTAHCEGLDKGQWSLFLILIVAIILGALGAGCLGYALHLLLHGK